MSQGRDFKKSMVSRRLYSRSPYTVIRAFRSLILILDGSLPGSDVIVMWQAIAFHVIHMPGKRQGLVLPGRTEDVTAQRIQEMGMVNQEATDMAPETWQRGLSSIRTMK